MRKESWKDLERQQIWIWIIGVPLFHGLLSYQLSVIAWGWRFLGHLWLLNWYLSNSCIGLWWLIVRILRRQEKYHYLNFRYRFRFSVQWHIMAYVLVPFGSYWRLLLLWRFFGIVDVWYNLGHQFFFEKLGNRSECVTWCIESVLFFRILGIKIETSVWQPILLQLYLPLKACTCCVGSLAVKDLPHWYRLLHYCSIDLTCVAECSFDIDNYNLEKLSGVCLNLGYLSIFKPVISFHVCVLADWGNSNLLVCGRWFPC